MKIEKMTLRFTSAALALAALSACGPVNRSFDTVKMPIVASNQLSHDVAANVSGIDPAGARALDDWFASINLGYGDRVTVDDPDRTSTRLNSSHSFASRLPSSA